MKKTLSIFVAILSLSLVLSSSIFASPSPRAQINEEEIRILHEQTYDLVMQGKEDLVDSQPLVKNTRKFLNKILNSMWNISVLWTYITASNLTNK